MGRAPGASDGADLRAPNKHHMSKLVDKTRTKGAKRTLLLVGGSFALLLAVIGAILPVMPTTPFLLLSAYCYARSSVRCHTWLTTNRLFGKYVTHVAQGRRLVSPHQERSDRLFLGHGFGLGLVARAQSDGEAAQLIHRGGNERLHRSPGPPTGAAPIGQGPVLSGMGLSSRRRLGERMPHAVFALGGA